MKLLSHYTSEPGLVAIVRSQTLWATEFLSLNDRTEFVYAMSAISEAAYGQLLSRLPDDLRDPTKNEADITKIVSGLMSQLRTQATHEGGYGSLYVTSFACGRNEDENERGILTLWDRYTQKRGYCLQFDKERLRRLIDNELRRYSYAWIELAEVKYGIDRNAREFRYLVEQMTRRLLHDIAQERQVYQLLPKPDEIDVDSVFFSRLMSFCGKHKDPSFSDERETRILAYPIDATIPRFLTGLAVSKPVHRRGNGGSGSRYIVLGDSTLPGLTPHRIIIGPGAAMDARTIHDLYPAPPLVSRSTIPII